MQTFPLRFDNAHVFVAGGSSGINLGIAHGFAAAGANISILARKAEKIDAAVAELKAHGGGVRGFSADVRNYEAVAGALKEAHGAFGDIAVLISGAAGNFVAPALGMSSNGFKAVMDIDLLGTFHVMRAAHAHLLKPGASFINITAPQSQRAMMLQAHVCAAKAGIDMLTRSLAMEWAADGIRVNAISPGPIEGTEGMSRLAPTPKAAEASKRGVPLGRWGRKEEIAWAAMFLSSPFAAYVSGAILPVDGGGSAGRYDPDLLGQFGQMGITSQV